MRRIILPLLLLLIGARIFWHPTSPYNRQTILVASSPIRVVSWNPTDKSQLTLLIPETVAAEGTRGYGTYTLEAFWHLGQIDKKDGTVLQETMSEALGIPITGYIGAKKGMLRDDAFSFPMLLSRASGGLLTNVPWWVYVQFVWRATMAKPLHADVIDFTEAPARIADDIPVADGTTRLTLNPDRIDARLAHMFEDERIRKETVTTAVYNTTSLPSLGTRAARLLSNLGVSVVFVGNDTPEQDACTVTGSKEALLKESAKVISSVMGCKQIERTESDRADLRVRIGKSWGHTSP